MNGDTFIRSKALPLIVLVVLSAVVGGYGYFVENSQQDAGRFYMRNTGGAVLFDHQAHIDLASDCVDCHHDVILAELENRCSDCHDDDFSEADFEHADLKDAHEHECIRCHQVNQSAAQKSCRECHPSTQENEAGIIPCTECHDDDYRADIMSHDDMLSVEGHTCESCHVVRSISDVYHEQCNRCHKRHDATKFVDVQGSSRCNMCHLK